MRLDVRLALMRTAKAFFDFIGIDDLELEDIILTGSNAAFNYTQYSDLDIHLIVDYDETRFPEFAEDFFMAKKLLWNEQHEILIKGYPVEVYVEDTKNPVTALGVYSLMDGVWLRKPTMKDTPEINDRAVVTKTNYFSNLIDDTLSQNPSSDEIDKLISRVRKLRKSGLAKSGEFSTENLVFKSLRNLGFVKRLYDAKTNAIDDELSLEGIENP